MRIETNDFVAQVLLNAFKSTTYKTRIFILRKDLEKF